MKKLSLKKLNLENSEVLTREQLKTVLGGDGSGGGSGSGNTDCISSYFYSGTDGCGITTCTGWTSVPGRCLCSTTITTPQPCGHA
ncbi:hypothetical protein [Solitalea lacus]|uniref:hypothetical protein n=1 Tax=Solitalea lacus TaxID=2911172 RepID=UPI001EDB1D57|nr:hypothetical protein [Solitalea lacus]UKJ07498.1 hypothetical protein L2B55_18510 [Solitalea lacus]